VPATTTTKSSAYAEVRIMPTVLVKVQVRAVSVAGCSA